MYIYLEQNLDIQRYLTFYQLPNCIPFSPSGMAFPCFYWCFTGKLAENVGRPSCMEDKVNMASYKGVLNNSILTWYNPPLYQTLTNLSWIPTSRSPSCDLWSHQTSTLTLFGPTEVDRARHRKCPFSGLYYMACCGSLSWLFSLSRM